MRPALVGLGLGVAAAALATLVSVTGLAGRFENESYDLRVRHSAVPVDPASPIVIVQINESSVRALEPVVGRWPWPRLVHGSAIDYLKRAGAKVIAYDVLFLEEDRSTTGVNGSQISGHDSDRAFAESVGKAGNVVLLADALFEGLLNERANAEPLSVPGTVYHPGPGFQVRPKVTLPYSGLASAAIGIGHNFLAKDENSDAARRMLPFIESQGVAIPSLGVAAALAFEGLPADRVGLDGNTLRLGDARMPLLADPVPTSSAASRQVLVRLSEPVTKDGVHTTFPTYSFFDVVLSEDNVLSGKPPAIPESAFAGKLVFVGTTAAGLLDLYSTPFEGGAAGVELHATVAENILSNHFMRRAPFGVDLAVTLAAGVTAGLVATTLPVAGAVGLVVALVSGLGLGLGVEVGRGLWIGAVAPAASAAIALFAGVAWRYFVEDRAKRHVRQLFGRYVSKDVIDQLMTDPARVALGGQRREMTVLFSDIRGFTTASEKSTPEAVVAQLNEYFGAMVEVLFRHQGTLDKFVGDMVMGLFGAPLPDARHADHAVAAALDMIRTLDALNQTWAGQGKPALNIGIGINSGEMIAGNIGSTAIMSYTAIGDAVNLGSRLESLNKDYGTHILMSDATRSRLTIAVDTRKIGDVTVKGKTEAVTVYEVLGTKEHDQ